MYKEHAKFKAPSPAAVLWRYMDLSKLIAMIHGGCLFFARADRLGDPWEGATSPVNVTFRQVLDLQTGAGYQQLGDLHKSTLRHTYISCWHESPHESAAMWKLYLSSAEGIAIQTTFERLRESFSKTDRDIFIGKVDYYDPMLEMWPEGNILRQYLYKRKSFEHEREVRAIFQDQPELGFERAEPAAEYGLNITVDIDTLIERVYLAPTSPAWIARVTQAVLDKFGLNRTTVQSSLSADPAF